MIYTDGSHITADTEPELHDFAKEMGLKRWWFCFCHYKIWGNVRKLIMRQPNVKRISPDELIAKSKEMIENANLYS